MNRECQSNKLHMFYLPSRAKSAHCEKLKTEIIAMDDADNVYFATSNIPFNGVDYPNAQFLVSLSDSDTLKIALTPYEKASENNPKRSILNKKLSELTKGDLVDMGRGTWNWGMYLGYKDCAIQ
jgi:hypothetical protein